MLWLALSGALLAAAPPQASAQTQGPPVTAATVQEPVDLGDVVVEGGRLSETTEAFVREVAQPARGRGLARWRDGVCVGVANLKGEVAHYIADRVSTVAQDLGLRIGDPGCEPSILIVAVADANAFTPQFIDRRPRLFLVGGSGMDLGRSALERFKTNDQPVRWWNVSIPVEATTGNIAIRLPGEAAPTIRTRASRITTDIVDDTKRAFIIVDIDKIAGVSLQQLGDYLAMVSLAQIDPEADTRGYATVLNIFKDPGQTDGLTDWDLAYLEGLYDAERNYRNPGSHRNEIAGSIVRAHRRITRAQDAAAGSTE